MTLTLYSKGLVGGPAPKSYHCVPSSICVALLSGEDLNYLEVCSASLTEDMQTVTGEGTQGGNLHD